jgi:tetratricopeptide (TPR) repeat protein
MLLRSCVAAVVLLVTPVGSASAQFTAPLGMTGSRFNDRIFSPGAFSTGRTGDWAVCTNDDERFEFEDILAACDRLVLEEQKPRARGAALWWRAYAHERVNDRDRADADYRAALWAYNEWVESGEEPLDSYLARARLHMTLGDYEAALVDYNLADDVLPRRPRVHEGRGMVAFLRGDYVLAIAEFDRAQRLARMDAAPLSFDHRRCEARAAAGVELTEARSICNRVVRDSNSQAGALIARAFLRFREGDLAGAQADFEFALRRDPEQAIAIYGLGVLAVRSGQESEGRAEMARGRSLDPFLVRYYEGAGLRP